MQIHFGLGGEGVDNPHREEEGRANNGSRVHQHCIYMKKKKRRRRGTFCSVQCNAQS